MELRSRSRSNTPLHVFENHNTTDNNYTNSPTNSSSMVLRSKKLRSVAEVTGELVTVKTATNHKSSKVSKHYTNFTSDYSSEDGEHDLSHTENNTNHALESKQEFHKITNEEFIALKMYRDAKEYWNMKISKKHLPAELKITPDIANMGASVLPLHKLFAGNDYQCYLFNQLIMCSLSKVSSLYPKTDYTYSPHSKDRVELAPGVVNMPNMSRRSIHPHGDTVDYHPQETITEKRMCPPRVLFTSSNNNEEYELERMKEKRYISASTSTREEISVLRRIFYSLFYVFYIASRPVVMTHSVVLQAVSQVHRFASSVMLLDTWLLRGRVSQVRDEESRQRRKLLSVIALCLLPLFFFGGIWLLTALGEVLATAIATTSEKLVSQPAEEVPPTIAAVSPPHAISHSSKPTEALIKIQLDSPLRTGLSNVQLKQLAQSLKENLNLDLDTDTIMRVLLLDPNVQRLDQSKPADIAAALTKDQIASISQNLHQFQRGSVDHIVEKVLESPSIQNMLVNYNANDQTDKVSAQEALIQELHLQVEKLRRDLSAAMLTNSANHLHLSHAIKRCCRLNSLQMEKYLNSLIATILKSDEHKDNMAQWLGTLFVAQNELELKLQNVTEHLNTRFDDLIKESAQIIMNDVSLKLEGRVANSNLKPDEKQIRAIVKSALAMYDADKTGLVDYALESAGGQILSTRCTEHYSARTSVVSIFGVPLWYPSASPRNVITPGVVPGQCWAFQSFPGFLIVKLSHNVTIDAFSYEHVSRHLTPSGKADSAPKNIQVYGLHNEFDREPVLLGEYQYDAFGDALQFFPVNDVQVVARSFQIVELKVNSNHGNPNYTCLYRFRVHGKIAT